MDLAMQTICPSQFIIVDADFDSGEVGRVLAQVRTDSAARFTHIPSNHRNLPYQRYLGWLAAKGRDVLLYLDDDLRIADAEFLTKILLPFTWEGRNIVGVTAPIQFSSRGATLSGGNGTKGKLAALFGSARRVAPGGLSPAGDRVSVRYDGRPYVSVSWLCGGVMAYSMRALSREVFSDALFSLYERRWGKGEDTVLSRRVNTKGGMLMACEAPVSHPDADDAQAYPRDPFRFARSVAYSRRLINDNYRGIDRAHWSDRAALVKSYLANCVWNGLDALVSQERAKFLYWAGYATGAALGLIAPPDARRLTPEIQWWSDAESTLESSLGILS
jgi:glycosyltransferase involved in cell wall biosynthesis